MLILNAENVRAALPMKDAISAMREAFAALHRGTATIPVRTHVDTGNLTMLTMPGVMREPDRVGAKIVSIVPRNAQRGLPVIQGLVVVFDPDTGAPLCLLDGQTLTAIRTGAASGLATDLLAPPDATCLTIMGSGPQAATQVEAVRAVRDIEQIVVWSRTERNAVQFARDLQANLRSEKVRCRTAPSPSAAVEQADIVCTATRATEPIVRRADLRGNVHVNAVGSYTLDMQELDVAMFRDATVVVDDVEAALTEAGELVRAMKSGVITRDHLTTLGAIATGDSAGPSRGDQVTVFKSVGVAVQDLSAAGWAAERAIRMNIGVNIEL